jgi:hypothetical protein
MQIHAVQADDMKEVTRVDFLDRYWKNISNEGTPVASHGLWE